MKVEIRLQGRVIPKDPAGDPAFPDLPAILKVFTPEEVTEIVNRWLYGAGYQQDYHRKSWKKRLELTKRLNQHLRERYGRTQARCTEKEIAEALMELARKGEGE